MHVLSYFSMKTYVVGTHCNCHGKMIPVSTHICLHAEIGRIYMVNVLKFWIPKFLIKWQKKKEKSYLNNPKYWDR